MRVKGRRDVGPRVVEIAWANGDRYYGSGFRLRVAVSAWIARYVHGRRSALEKD